VKFKVKLSGPASRYLDRLDGPTRARFRDALTRLEDDPFAGGSKALKGRSDRSLRIGTWRVLYDVDMAARLVRVHVIATRGQAYRGR
jgi:mRNA-degrading endonuclease RelE of RelBE toxin-antitoxin system